MEITDNNSKKNNLQKVTNILNIIVILSIFMSSLAYAMYASQHGLGFDFQSPGIILIYSIFILSFFIVGLSFHLTGELAVLLMVKVTQIYGKKNSLLRWLGAINLALFISLIISVHIFIYPDTILSTLSLSDFSIVVSLFFTVFHSAFEYNKGKEVNRTKIHKLKHKLKNICLIPIFSLLNPENIALGDMKDFSERNVFYYKHIKKHCNGDTHTAVMAAILILMSGIAIVAIYSFEVSINHIDIMLYIAVVLTFSTLSLFMMRMSRSLLKYLIIFLLIMLSVYMNVDNISKLSNIMIVNADITTSKAFYQNATILNSEASPLPIECKGSLIYLHDYDNITIKNNGEVANVQKSLIQYIC